MERPDPRVHKTLIDEEKVQWMTNLKPGQVRILNALLQEAEEFNDDELRAYCNRFMVLRTAVGGQRADMVSETARYEDAPKQAPQDNVVHRGYDREAKDAPEPERPRA